MAASADTLVTHVNVEAGARALAPADFHYVDFWSGSGTMVGSGEKSALENIKHARRQARAGLEAVQAVREGRGG